MLNDIQFSIKSCDRHHNRKLSCCSQDEWLRSRSCY